MIHEIVFQRSSSLEVSIHRCIVVVIFMKEGLGMPKVILIAAVTAFSLLGMLTAKFAVAADAPGGRLDQLTTSSVESL